MKELSDEYKEYKKYERDKKKQLIEENKTNLDLGITTFLDKYLIGYTTINAKSEEIQISLEDDFKTLDNPKDRLTVFMKMVEYLKGKEVKEKAKVENNTSKILIAGQLIEI